MTVLEEDFHKLNLRKNSYKYNMTLQIIQGNPVYTVLSGTKWGWQDYTNDVVDVLKKLGVKYKIGNDAPRGGKLGTYVEVTIADIRSYCINKIISE